MKILLSLSFVILFFAGTVQAENFCAYSKDQISGGGGVPWPWSKELKFAWTRLQGTWSTSSDNCQSLFFFNISPAGVGGKRIVTIQQINPETCSVIATGTGQEQGNLVHALMTSSNRRYELTIRAFSEEDVRTSGGFEIDPKNVKFRVVLSLYPRDNWEKQVSYEIERMQMGRSAACGSNNVSKR